jgi:hypothetical protein
MMRLLTNRFRIVQKISGRKLTKAQQVRVIGMAQPSAEGGTRCFIGVLFFW